MMAGGFSTFICDAENVLGGARGYGEYMRGFEWKLNMEIKFKMTSGRTVFFFGSLAVHGGAYCEAAGSVL